MGGWISKEKKVENNNAPRGGSGDEPTVSKLFVMTPAGLSANAEAIDCCSLSLKHPKDGLPDDDDIFSNNFFGKLFGDDEPSGAIPFTLDDDDDLSLENVGGLDEHIMYLRRAVMYPLTHKDELKQWGIDPPKGIMFHGPPGTGKTLLAKALASELSQSMEKVTFFYQKGGECFSKWVGETEKNLRKIFDAAKKAKPSILFFDEIDGLCPNREKTSETSEVYAQVVTSMLGLIDSVNRGEVFIIGATNRLDAVDPAIRRPGRFDKDLAFALPDEAGRKIIIGIHTNKWEKDKPCGDLLNDISRSTLGYTGADLEKLCRDSVSAGIARSGDIPLDRVKITRQDWATAIQNMHASSANVYGSTLHISLPPSKVLHPLIENIVEEIVTRLRAVLPMERVKHDQLQYLGRKSFLIWESDPLSVDFMNVTIMKGVLSDKRINRIPTYILNDEALITKSGANKTLTHVVKSVIQQAINSSKPCILYIPGIDLVEEMLKKGGVTSVFYNMLMNVRSHSVMLLATGSKPVGEMSEEMRNLFVGVGRSFMMRTPDEEERMSFFLQIFCELILSEPPKKKQKKNVGLGVGNDKKDEEVGGVDDFVEEFEAQLVTAVESTQGHRWERIFRLFDELKDAKSLCLLDEVEQESGRVDRATLKREFERVLGTYCGE